MTFNITEARLAVRKYERAVRIFKNKESNNEHSKLLKKQTEK